MKHPTKWLLLGITVIFTMIPFGCSRPVPLSDAQFAKTSFESLIRADPSAESLVDFEHLWCPFGDPIGDGDVYNALRSNREKANYRTSFVNRFGSSIRDTGLAAESLENWHAGGVDSSYVTVFAEARNGFGLILTISKLNDEQKLSGVSIVAS